MSSTSSTLRHPQSTNLPHLRSYLEAVVASHQFSYVQKRAIVFFFEDNSSDAQTDATDLADCLQDVFGMTVSVVKLSQDDQVPAWTLVHTINENVGSIGPHNKENRRSLMIMVYVGDSTINETGSLVLTSANEHQTIQWSTIQKTLFTDIETMSHVDTLGIFDGCPVPESADISRACQVLSSERFEGTTLTECLADAVHALRQKGGA